MNAAAGHALQHHRQSAVQLGAIFCRHSHLQHLRACAWPADTCKSRGSVSKSFANDKGRMGPASTSCCMRTAPWAGVSHVERGIEQHTQHEVAAAASFYKGVVEKIVAAPEAKHDCAVGLRHESREKNCESSSRRQRHGLAHAALTVMRQRMLNAAANATVTR